MQCQMPPAGWYCTRAAGHTGPCAALPEPGLLAAPTTTPPASPEAKALRAVGAELDVVGEALTELAAHTETLAELGTNDHKSQQTALARIESKLDDALSYLRDHAARVGELEQWRGDHERTHARQ